MEKIAACVLIVMIMSVMIITLKFDYESEHPMIHADRDPLRAVRGEDEPKSAINSNFSTYPVKAGISEAMDRGS